MQAGLLKKIYIFDEVFLKYVQFRTLHHRFFTNDLLKKCNLIDSDSCSCCKTEIDSNFHMLIKSTVVDVLWNDLTGLP